MQKIKSQGFTSVSAEQKADPERGTTRCRMRPSPERRAPARRGSRAPGVREAVVRARGKTEIRETFDRPVAAVTGEQWRARAGAGSRHGPSASGTHGHALRAHRAGRRREAAARMVVAESARKCQPVAHGPCSAGEFWPVLYDYMISFIIFFEVSTYFQCHDAW